MQKAIFESCLLSFPDRVDLHQLVKGYRLGHSAHSVPAVIAKSKQLNVRSFSSKLFLQLNKMGVGGPITSYEIIVGNVTPLAVRSIRQVVHFICNRSWGRVQLHHACLNSVAMHLFFINAAVYVKWSQCIYTFSGKI